MKLIKLDYNNPIAYQFYIDSKIHSKNLSHNLVSLFRSDKQLNRHTLRKTLQFITNHFDVFNSQFTIDANERTTSSQRFMLYEKEVYSDVLLSSIINEPLCLDKPPLLRVYTFRRKDDYHLLFIFHHIIFDLRSKEIFAETFSNIYTQLSYDIIPEFKEALQYYEYESWYKNFIHSVSYKKMLSYWNTEGIDNYILNLPYDKKREDLPSRSGKKIYGKIPDPQRDLLLEFCRIYYSDPFLVLLTIYSVLLYRFSGQNQFNIGIPRTNRPSGFENTIGCFVNILPLCLNIDSDMTILELLKQIRHKMLDMHRNQYVPFIEVLKLTKVKRNTSYNPLFQVGFTFEPPMQLELDGMRMTPLDVAPNASLLDLFFYFWQTDGSFHWAVEYSTDLFYQEKVELFITSFLWLMEEGLVNCNQKIDTLSLVNHDCHKNLEVWNNTFCDYKIENGVINFFFDQAINRPNEKALILRGEYVTYGELVQKIISLAEELSQRGVGPETIVGIALERSIEMVVGMYAIVLAGGTYLPIEPTLPSGYVSYILEDSQLAFVLSREKYQYLFPNICNFIAFDTFRFPQNSEKLVFPRINIDPDSRVYILYTSGSTGRPKGVEITHRGLLNRLLWMDEEYKLQEGDVLFQKTPYNFDVSGWEFWWPLMKGVPLVIAEPEGHKDNDYLLKTIEKEKVTIIHFVPSMLREFLKFCKKGNCPSLRDVMCSGEALPAAVVREFYEILPHARLHNLYGPTEASIDVTYWPCTPDCTVVPIGRPVANTKIHILDEALNPLPPGVTGEIYIAGVQLARGYLNKPELTAERFVPNPFDGGRMYKTGDLGQWNLQGEILYLGRNDSQVQLHGLRIELGEIENRIIDHPAVDMVAVIIHGEFGAEQSLVAYIVKRAELTSEEMISFLSTRLPLHMVPKRLIFVDEIRLNANGKLDRKSLPDPGTVQSQPDKPLILPEGEGETFIADLWKRMLGVDRIGREENFFELGGSSLHIIQMQRELSEKLGRTIPITDLFIHTTVKGLADYMENHDTGRQEKDRVMDRAERSRQAAHRLKNIRKI